MFERYTEKARRVVFFARYEASQYGSQRIESEHLLLGLLREDRALANRFLRPSAVSGIRGEIEKQITRGKRLPTSLEMPISEDCRKIFRLAGEEADRLAERHIGTEHLLLAMTRMESSLAGRLLREKGLKPDSIRADVAKSSAAPSGATSAHSRPTPETIEAVNSQVIGASHRYLAGNALNSFLAGLKSYDWERLTPFFAENAQFVDAAGKRWKGRAEIEKQFEGLFAPYAKKNVTFLIESTDPGPAGSFLASILWENVSMGIQPRSLHRMTIIFAPENEDWAISLIQVTPVLV